MGERPTKPLIETDPRANAFDFPGGPESVLLIHGFTGTPAEMRPVGEAISNQLKWRAVGPLLPGHGTFPDDLNHYRWKDWISAVEQSFALVSAKSEHIHVAGLSMGALLAAQLARNHPHAISSLGLFAPALFLRPWYVEWGADLMRLPFLQKLFPRFQKRSTPHPDHITYREYPSYALGEFRTLAAGLKKMERFEAPPTFVCVSDSDELVNPKSAEFLADRLSNPLTRVLHLKRSIHAVTLGVERETLLHQYVTFLHEAVPLSRKKVS